MDNKIVNSEWSMVNEMHVRKKYSRLKKWLVVVVLLLLTFWGYVELVNRNSTNMTLKQKILKAIYPVFSRISKLNKNRNIAMNNTEHIQPSQSLYAIPVTMNNGNTISLEKYKGKKLLLVNTASECGYTPQYAALQELAEKYENKLVIIGFPANDFGEQEKGSDEQIAQFCKVNFGVTFPLAKKSTVIKSGEQNEIFKWLTDKSKNGWNDKAPTWNFSKYLIDEQGVLINYFDPAIDPNSEEITKAIDAK